MTTLPRRANIEGMHPHRFRHSYAINALRAGMPEQVLKIVGGWRKIPETYFKTLGEEDAIEFHRQISRGTGWGGRLRGGKGDSRVGSEERCSGDYSEGSFRVAHPTRLLNVGLSNRRFVHPSSCCHARGGRL